MHDPFSCNDPLFSEIYSAYWNTPVHTTFCWIPAHKGYNGNEVADFLAKSGASSSDLSIPLARQLYKSKSVLKTALRTTLQTHLQSNWEKAIASRPHTASLIPNYAALLRFGRYSSSTYAVNRLVSGHIPTRIYKRDKLHLDFSGRCPYCAVPDTIHHHVLSCPALAPLRSQFLGHPDLSHLLLSDLLQDRKLLQGLHDFLQSTL